MARIILNITYKSPFLQTLSGEVVVEWIDYRNISSQVTPLLKCEFSCKPNQTGFSNPAGYDAAIFEALKPQIDTMIHSYKRGMLLSPHDYSWVEETKDVSLDTWKTEKVKEYEASYERNHSKHERKNK